MRLTADDKIVIQQALENASFENGAGIRVDYSGRCMYGKTCFALVGDEDILWDTLMDAQVEIARETPDHLKSPRIPSPSRDNMGWEMVWYWEELSSEG